jgi:hypothetical protein
MSRSKKLKKMMKICNNTMLIIEEFKLAYRIIMHLNEKEGKGKDTTQRICKNRWGN